MSEKPPHDSAHGLNIDHAYLAQIDNVEPIDSARQRRRRPADPDHDPNFKFDAISWGKIRTTDYPKIRWIVPGIIPEGLTLISGPPKIGKSWLALNLCFAVAAGGVALGQVPVSQGKVLYLALEDNERRLQARGKAIQEKLMEQPDIDEKLYFVTKCARLDSGLVDAIVNFLEEHPDIALVIIDTLARIRPSKRAKGYNAYDNDYSELAVLQKLSSDHRIAIALFHHNRKGSAEDILEEVSGSMGTSGCADTIAVMKRDRGQDAATLFVTGRDIEGEQLYGLQFDKTLLSWRISGQGPEIGLSEEKQDILDIVQEHGGKRAIELTRIIHGEDTTTKSKEHKRVSKHLGELIAQNILRKEGDFYFYHKPQ